MIVIAVLAVVSVAAALALPSAAHRQLHEEGLRLVTLIEIARAQSRASGLQVHLQVDEHGFEFKGPVALSSTSGNWLYPQTHAHAQTLLLGPEPVIAAQRLLLSRTKELRLVLASDGVKPFEMQMP